MVGCRNRRRVGETDGDVGTRFERGEFFFFKQKTAYEINRLSYYGANDYANKASGIARPIYTRNQFGGSAGGPIKKDKLFFFVSPEWTRVRSSSPTQAVIPDQNLIHASDAATTQAFFTAFGQLSYKDTTI